MLTTFLTAFLVSVVATLWLVRSEHRHGVFSADHDLTGPQKFHARPVPRVGGVGVVIALLAAALFSWAAHGPEIGKTALWLLLCGTPAFACGLLEDVTKKVPPRWRLLATAVSALLAAWVLGAVIPRTDLWGFQWIASFSVGAVLLAVLTVSGIANSINIIDGFNGLASMCVAIMLVAIAYVANEVGDAQIEALALLGIGAVLGFFIWNFPAGLIFLGDGGAYFLGYYVSELGILLLLRNAEVSPLFPLLMSIYPVFETLFTMYRRKVIQGRSVGVPDGVHLHSLIYRRMLRWAVGRSDAAQLVHRTSLTAPYLWLLCMLAVIPSVLFWDDSRVLGSFIVLFAATYIVLYRRIVHFKVPRWLVRR